MDDIQIHVSRPVKTADKSSSAPKLSVRQQKKERIQQKLLKKQKFKSPLHQAAPLSTHLQTPQQSHPPSTAPRSRPEFPKHPSTDRNHTPLLRSSRSGEPPKRPKQNYVQEPKPVKLPTAEIEEEPKNDGEIFTSNLFSDLQYIHANVKKGLELSNYVKMTRIQHKAIPIVHEKKNLFIKSETGSGKTLAYLVPLFSNLMHSETRITREHGTQILVVCPTRELSHQCVEVALQCGKKCPNIVIGALVGGENPKHEKARLRKGVTILIGTPGRLLYHMQNTQSFKFDGINTLVFEECDRILDLGFKKDVEQILELLSQKISLEDAQKIMVSAHVNQNICQIKGLDIRKENYEFVGFTVESLNQERPKNKKQLKTGDPAQQVEFCEFLGQGDETWEIPATLQQYYTTIAEQQKLPFLFSFIQSQQGKKTIIFVSTCDEVEFFSYLFQQQELFNPLKEGETAGEKKVKSKDGEKVEKQLIVQQEVYKLHGNIEQKERSKTYFSFKKSTNPMGCILVSTSVASRGLDFPDVSSILLFDPPDSFDDYINKVGRTARINRNGLSLLVLFENNESHNFILEVQNHLQSTLSFVDCAQYFRSFQYYLFKSLSVKDQYPDKFLGMMIRKSIQKNHDTYMMSRRAFVSFVRAYGRLKKFRIKTLNLHKLSKSFGLDEAAAKETQEEQYQHELIRTNREKFRRQGANLKENKWDEIRKKRKVVSEKELNKMEFM